MNCFLKLKKFYKPRIILIWLLFIGCLMMIFYYDILRINLNDSVSSPDSNAIDIMYVACGKEHIAYEAKQPITLAILFSYSKLNIHLVVEKETKQGFEQIYSQFPVRIRKRVEFIYYEPWFPEENNDWWRNNYKTCATQKIFAHHLIKRTNKILFMDLDAFILSNLEEIWANFDLLSDTNIIGITPDCNSIMCAYGNKDFRPYPRVGDHGINSGILFMKLDKMRNFYFTQKMINLLRIYKGKLYLPEQDLLNILFHNDTDKIRIFPSEYNYFYPYCDIKQTSNGFYSDYRDVSIFHAAGSYYKLNHTLINYLYEKVKQVNFKDQSEIEILADLADQLDFFRANIQMRDNCSCIQQYLIKNFKKEIISRINKQIIF